MAGLGPVEEVRIESGVDGSVEQRWRMHCLIVEGDPFAMLAPEDEVLQVTPLSRVVLRGELPMLVIYRARVRQADARG